MDIDLRKLNHVVTVARTGSFSRAADELHITQPALSRSIAAVETHFGLKIFDRSRNGSTLTPIGALAVAEAEALIRQARTLGHNMQLYASGEGGSIHFGMAPLLASLVLPTLSVDFLTQHPTLNLRAIVKSANVLLQALKNDEVELFFYGKAQLQPSQEFVIEPVGSISLATVVRSQHPLATSKSVSRKDLAEYPTLSAVELSPDTPSMPGGAFICDNYDLLRHTILHTDGVWVTSPQLVREELKTGKLTEITVASESGHLTRPTQVEVCMVHLKGRTLSPSGSAIAAYVKKYLANNSGSLDT